MSFEQALLEIYPWIFRVARRFCSSVQDAEDLAGDTVYKILQNQDKFDCSKPMKPWCIYAETHDRGHKPSSRFGFFINK